MRAGRGVAIVVAFAALGAAWITPATASGSMGMDHRPPPLSASVPVRTPAGMLPGIDVSHYQNTIDWARVAGSGVQFAVMKATEGKNYVDPTFATNAQQAAANGIAVGAYHFADPSTSMADARDEADHFVAVAAPVAGNLVPALDIEHTNGLSVTQLKAWVKAWLLEVTARTGLHPMVYTSPNFWLTAMGDSPWFSANGYPVLWIAHWFVQSPTVPALNWSGYGWTYWQWTDCASVPGIANCVDGDRFNGTNLARGEIGRVQAAATPGGTVTSDSGIIACTAAGGTCTQLTDPGASVTLTAGPDPGAVFIDWTGECAGQGAVCALSVTGKVSTSAEFGYPVTAGVAGTGNGTVVGSGTGIDCGAVCSDIAIYGATVTFRATPDSASGFDGWSGSCQGTDPACTVTVNGPIAVTARFDATVSIPADGDGTRFAWGRVRNRHALGRSYLVDHRKGASVSFAFTGSKVAWYSADGPKGGVASVSVDGSAVAAASTYASSPRFGVAHELSGLGAGSHTLTIMVAGRRSPHSSGDQVGVDAVKKSGALSTSPVPSAATWSPALQPITGTGPTLVSDTAGSFASLTFQGTGVSFDTVLGPTMGRAAVYIDGHLVRTVDLSSPATVNSTRGVSGLADASHTIRVVVQGEHGKHGKGTAVTIAGWTLS